MRELSCALFYFSAHQNSMATVETLVFSFAANRFVNDSKRMVAHQGRRLIPLARSVSVSDKAVGVFRLTHGVKGRDQLAFRRDRIPTARRIIAAFSVPKGPF